MSNEKQISDLIEAKDYPLRDILSGKKYTVDYFQREYNWGEKNVDQLVYDLTATFMNYYRPEHTSQDVAKYNSYFMGPIVLSDKGGEFSIIDGQQRITTLTLLLIYLYHKTTNPDVKNEISPMVFSSSYGKKSFNITIEGREVCLKELYENGTYTPSNEDDESTKKMFNNYLLLDSAFPDDVINKTSLDCFSYWIMNKLIFVKIIAHSEENAYTIFETMNDRGLSLTASEMLKGFVLSKIADATARNNINKMWKRNSEKLNSLGKDIETQFLQSWLRAKFAETIRDTKVGALNQDFENIGTRFHNWFKENIDKGLLKKAINGGIESFMVKNYSFFMKSFFTIKDAEKKLTNGLEHVYYSNIWGIADSLRYPLLLAPINPLDDEATAKKKIELVAFYIDTFAVRRSVNFKKFGAASIRYTMCNLVKEVRDRDLDSLFSLISQKINELDYSFSAISEFRMHGMNKPFVKYFLCRLTSYVEHSSGEPNHFVQYMFNPDGKAYEIEHIWADKFDQHGDEFSQSVDFEECRNSIGDLLLLPNGSNQAYGDLPYNEKSTHYIKENLLAKSLCSKAYDLNPNFTHFITNEHINGFVPHDTFKKDDIYKRAKLYKELADRIWNIDSIK